MYLPDAHPAGGGGGAVQPRGARLRGGARGAPQPAAPGDGGGPPPHVARPRTTRSTAEWGWQIFRQAFELFCRSKVGYAGLLDVREERPRRDSTMQSFFLAETRKCLYLLFSEHDLLPLDHWVFNTEAHPLRVTLDLLHPDPFACSAEANAPVPSGAARAVDWWAGS
eukprot:scaffold398_cov305-Prasinococcus_capsulatus_cf.AAC.5